MAGVAGCASSVLGPDSPVAGTEMTVLPPDSDAADAVSDFTDPPRVAFDPGQNEVVIVGALAVGSSTCNKAVVESVAYSRDDDSLRVVVGSGRQQGAGETCTGDESVDVYRVVVSFEGGYPAVVVATERSDEGERSARAEYDGAST